MKYKVVTHRNRAAHYYAQCLEPGCTWSAGVFTKQHPTHADVRNATRKHVSQTGHGVVLGAGKETFYSAVTPTPPQAAERK